MRWIRLRRSLVGICRKDSHELRRLMEARLGKKGKREYVQTLRLLETFALPEVARAIDDALRLGAISFDAVKHLLLCRIERRPARLDLENYPHLPAGASRHHCGRRLSGAAGRPADGHARRSCWIII